MQDGQAGIGGGQHGGHILLGGNTGKEDVIQFQAGGFSLQAGALFAVAKENDADVGLGFQALGGAQEGVDVVGLAERPGIEDDEAVLQTQAAAHRAAVNFGGEHVHVGAIRDEGDF